MTALRKGIGTADLDWVEAEPWRIMVAEDSGFWRNIVRSGIADFSTDLQVIEAADGKSALDILAGQRIDLAFVDLAMPEINGDEVVRRAQVHGKMPFFAVISVNSDAAEVARMRKLSAYDYLVKPFGAQEIKRVLTTYERVAHATRVMIVDDSGTARSIIARILKRSIFNFEIVDAGDGVTAFELYAERPADIVFLDLNMPGLDGVQTMRLLRAHNRAVRIVLMSGSQEALDRHAGMAPAAILKKPFFPVDLDRVVHGLFELPLPFSGQA
jgi:CheY-like chemotaxis protein